MSHVLTMKLTFMETVVLCKALGLYVEAPAAESEEDIAEAKMMLREVQRALARGPVAESTSLVRSPSAVDQRRLRDGVNALEVSSRTTDTMAEVRKQLEIVSAGIAALQSLDDLGPEANTRARNDEQELWRRMKALKKHLKDLEGKAGKS